MSLPNLLFSFKGRLGRRSYWLASWFPLVVLLLALFLLDSQGLSSKTIRLAFIALFLTGIWSQLAISVKRCHDMNFSAWWLLIWLIPYAGNLAWFFWGGFVRGSQGSNQFGSDPLLGNQNARRSPALEAVKNLLVAGPAVMMVLFLVFRAAGLIRPCNNPVSDSMAPAIARGDHVMTENFSYLIREPRRGDVVIFKTKGVPTVPDGQIWTKRIAGLPGERLRITDGRLYVNGTAITLTNKQGEIEYPLPPVLPTFTPPEFLAANEELTIPEKSYYLLGDNSTNSFDSRFWGFVSADNIKGRVWFCYLPLQNLGPVK